MNRERIAGFRGHDRMGKPRAQFACLREGDADVSVLVAILRIGVEKTCPRDGQICFAPAVEDRARKAYVEITDRVVDGAIAAVARAAPADALRPIFVTVA